MPGLALGLMFVGYAVGYYGVTQVRGGNWGFLDLVVPGRWAGAAATAPDTGSAISVSSTPGEVPGGVANSVGGGPGLPANGVQPVMIWPQAGGATGVDQFGNTYNKVNGVWVPTLQSGQIIANQGAGSNVNTQGGPSVPGLGSGVPVA